ncbi:unnamed protein product [Effrenium voratum]|uniref:Pentatricopeptide repeat-containing protein, chloroplastic n=1 Tax=Effrenium voratum TaxID=2562239 RepID=A0AA36HX57_9DINO|nr:unnamed protein product [Effrenium voratum]
MGRRLRARAASRSKKFWLQQQLREGQTASSQLQIAHALAQLRKGGFLASPQENAVAIHALGRVGWWQDALALLSARAEGNTESTSMCNAALGALETAPLRWQRSCMLWAGTKSPDISTRNSVTTALRGALLWEQSLSFSAASAAASCRIREGERGAASKSENIVCYNILLAAADAVRCSWRRTIEHLRAFAVAEKDVVSLNSALSALGSKAQWKTCCGVICAACSSRVVLWPKSAQGSTGGMETMWAARRGQIRPDAASFNPIIGAAQVSWNFAMQTFETLRVTSTPSLVSINVFLRAMGDGHWRWECAVQTLEDLQWQGCHKEKLKPDLFTFSSLAFILQGYARWEQALHLAQGCGGGRAAPLASKAPSASSAPMLQAVVAAAELAGCWERTLDLLWWAKARSTETAPSAATAASAMSKSKQWQKALGCTRFSGPLKLMAINSALAAHVRGLQWNVVLSALRAMASSMLQADDFTCTSAITACEKGRWPISLRVLQSIRRLSAEASWPTVNAALSSCGTGRTWRFSMNLLDPLTGDASEESRPGVAATLLALAEEGQWSIAAGLLDKLSARSVKPDIASCGPLLMYCEQAGLVGQENVLLTLGDVGMDAQANLAQLAQMVGKMCEGANVALRLRL